MFKPIKKIIIIIIGTKKKKLQFVIRDKIRCFILFEKNVLLLTFVFKN